MRRYGVMVRWPSNKRNVLQLVNLPVLSNLTFAMAGGFKLIQRLFIATCSWEKKSQAPILVPQGLG